MSNIRLVIFFLGLTLILSLCLIAWLLQSDKSVPDVFVATAAGALGGLTGLLVPNRTVD